MSSPIRLVVFDLGRVLVRICDSWKHASQLAKLQNFPDMSDAARTAMRELVFTVEKGQMTQEQFCSDAAKVLGVSPWDVAAISDIYLLDVFPGVPLLLEELFCAGCQTACLSNTNASHWQQMSQPGNCCSVPFDLLTHHFGSHLIGLRKPDPKIYEHVEQQTNLAGPQIVFFDDMLENVQAARQRGWWAEQILPDENPVEQMRRHLQRLHVLRD